MKYTLNTMRKHLDREGHSYRLVEMAYDDGPKAGIMVDTNYDGMYPSREAMHKQTAVRQYASRYNLFSEARGHYTGVLITEK